MDYMDIINFWFQEIEPKAWWQKDDAFDQLIASRFHPYHAAAVRCELARWRQDSLGRLAEIIIIDQFSRNIYRGQPLAFIYDPLALALSQEAVRSQAQKDLTPIQKAFLYMPYMHSESGQIHEQAVVLFCEPGMEQNLDFELKHKAIIDRFGRYPHRNQILGRDSTDEELAFLHQPGSSF